MWTRNKVLLGAAHSGSTATYLVADFDALTLSWRTGSNASASRLTVYGSNADGFKSALPAAAQWSVITAVAAQGIFAVDNGFKWMMVVRADFGISGSSCNTVELLGQVR